MGLDRLVIAGVVTLAAAGLVLGAPDGPNDGQTADDLRRELAVARAMIAERDARIQAMAADRVRLAADLEQFRTQANRLAVAERQHAQINDALQKEIVERRRRTLDLEKERLELIEQLRRVTERNRELEKALREARKAGEGAGSPR